MIAIGAGLRRIWASPAPRSRRSVSPARCTARCCSTSRRRGGPPRHPVERPANRGRVRRDPATGRRRPPDRGHRQRCPDRVHGSQAAVGAATRARDWATGQPRPPPQGLRPLPPHRRLRGRRRRRLRHDPVRPRRQNLVARDARGPRHRPALLPPTRSKARPITGSVTAEAAAATGPPRRDAGRGRRRRPVRQCRRGGGGGPRGRRPFARDLRGGLRHHRRAGDRELAAGSTPSVMRCPDGGT